MIKDWMCFYWHVIKQDGCVVEFKVAMARSYDRFHQNKNLKDLLDLLKVQ